VYKPLYIAAPIIAVVFALTSIALIPIGNDVTILGYRIPLQIADVNIGLLVVLGVTRWVYMELRFRAGRPQQVSLLGGLRASAQMISYEIALGLSLVGVLIMAGSFSLRDIVNAQGDIILDSFPLECFPPAYRIFIYLMAAYAENNRIRLICRKQKQN